MLPTSINVKVRVQPRSSRDEVVGLEAGVLRVRLTAIPERGRANEALVELLADSLGVPKRAVQITRGHGSRDKWVSIEGLDHSELERRLGNAVRHR